jgi:hypothetical protein
VSAAESAIEHGDYILGRVTVDKLANAKLDRDGSAPDLLLLIVRGDETRELARALNSWQLNDVTVSAVDAQALHEGGARLQLFDEDDKDMAPVQSMASYREFWGNLIATCSVAAAADDGIRRFGCDSSGVSLIDPLKRVGS